MAEELKYWLEFENNRIVSPTGKYLYVEGLQSFMGVLNFVNEINELLKKKGKKK